MVVKPHHRSIPIYQSMILAVLAACVVLVVGTIGFKVIEGWSWFDSLYMSVITLATVGYGEVHPLSQLGRGFAIILILVGTAIIFASIGVMTSFFVELNFSKVFQQRRMMRKINQLENHYIICGADAVGEQVIERLIKAGVQFVIIEQKDVQLDALFMRFGDYTFFVQGDATDEDTLRSAGVERAKGLITTLPTDAANLFVVVTAKDLNPNMKIVSRAIEPSSISKLKKVGAHHVISPNIISAERMASVVLKPNVVSFLDTIITDDENMALLMEEVAIPAKSHLNGLTLAQARIPQETGLMVIAIKSGANGKFAFNPGSSAGLNTGDVLIVLGTDGQIGQLQVYAAREK